MADRSCAKCGADISGLFERQDNLSDLGYLHEDVHVDCPECGHSHAFGVPVNRPTEEPPQCPCCQGRVYPYKVNRNGSPGLRNVHWKCEDCFYFQTMGPTHRDGSISYLGVEHLRGEFDA